MTEGTGVPNWVKRVIFLSVVLLLAIVLKPFKIIDAGERGVVLHFGSVEELILPEGIHYRTPVFTTIKALDVKTQRLLQKADAYSKDLQQVNAEIVLNYHLDPGKVNKLWQEIGPGYEERIIDPAIQESVKAATAKFTAQMLIEERPLVKAEIKNNLVERLTPRHMIVDDFSIVSFSFSDTYEKAIEEKQVAQQNALKAENDLTRIKTEASQRVAQATAEAEAIKIQAQAINSTGGRDYVQLQAIKKWDGMLPKQMIPNATVPFIDLQK